MKIFMHCAVWLLLVTCFSCKKKEYPETSVDGAPVFNCNVTVNGNPLSIQAGINNYYMYSSFTQDSGNVYGFIASLKQTDCNTCANSIQIQVNDFKVSLPNANAQIDSSLMVGSYNYVGSNSSSFYAVQFQSSYNKTAATYLWNFGDGSSSNLANPTHLYKIKGNYNVSLSITGTNSCVSTVNSYQRIGMQTNSAFRASVIDSSTFGNYASFMANVVQGSPPYSYLWNFGDGSPLITGSSVSHNYQYTGGYPVTLRVIDQNNDTAYARYNMVTQNDVSSCSANYSISSVNATPNILGLSNIVIKWTDANGVVYTSKNTLQPANSYFTILSVDDFQKNDNNQTTKKLHVKFKCTVYNGSSSITLDNAEAYIGVAYK